MPHRLDPHRALWRLLYATGAGLAGTAFLAGLGAALAALSGFNLGSAVLLVLAWLPIVSADATATRERAGSDDPGRTVVYVVVIVVSAVSLFAAVLLTRRARLLAPGQERFLVGLCLSTVTLAWMLTHTAFTLRYARLYYREDEEGVGGVTFPGDQPPTYFDFAYFAFTIGMCFQVSDTVVTSHQIRRTVLVHAMISFAYNTAILAFVLNLTFGAVA